jgi:hypothetical protein
LDEELVTIYRPVGVRELDLIAASGYRRWPPRLPDQPIFYPVTNLEYAREITVKWNVPASGAGYVMKCSVKKSFMDRYSIHQVGGENHTEWWIPAGDLEQLNDHIVGSIQLLEEYGNPDLASMPKEE